MTAAELASGRAQVPPVAVKPLQAAQVWPSLTRGTPYDRPAQAPAQFGVGDPVRTRNDHPLGHTRLPRYARDKVGVIERCHGVFVFPDSNAAGSGEAPQWLYAVRFDGRDLWGRSGDPSLAVSVDAWESYLVPA